MTTGLGVQVFTIETWFKRTGAGITTSTGNGGLGAAIPLVTKGRGENENSDVDMNYFFGIDTTGVLAADFEECARSQAGCPQTTSNATQGGQNYPVRGSTIISNNVWYHAAVTFDGRYWKLYLNGVLEPTMTGADTGASRYPRWDSRQHAGLGTAMTSGGVAAGYFQGIIDEPRIWNVVRTQVEIQADMNNELTSGTGLIGRWGLNEGTGITAANSIAGRPNLTNNLMPNATPPAWVTADLIPPAAPMGLSALPYNGGVALGWNANTETDLAGYNLYRGTTMGGPYTKVNTALIAGLNYSDGGLTNGTSYYYVLRAVDNSSNKSGNSTEASAMPLASLGAGLNFDGTNDYVTFGSVSGLGLLSFTIETWFYWTGGGDTVSTGSGGLEGTNVAIPLVAKGRGEGDGSNVDMNYFFGLSNGKLAADFEEDETGPNANGLNHPVIGNATVSTNTWHHAAVTYDGQVWKLYLDGNLDKTLDLGTTLWPRDDSIQHAGLATAMTSNGTTDGFFQGQMDEVRIWNVARTEAQIRSTANSQTTSGTGLVARWGMGEGSGTTIASSVGTFPGTLTGGPSFVAGAPFNLVFDTTPPAAPTNLMASPQPGAVQLEWTANTEMDLAGYRIYRSTSSPVTKGTPINGTLTTPSYVDGAVTAGTTYYYAVAAVDTSGNESGLSNEVNAVPLPPPPAEALDLGSNHAYVTFGQAPDWESRPSPSKPGSRKQGRV